MSVTEEVSQEDRSRVEILEFSNIEDMFVTEKYSKKTGQEWKFWNFET